MIIYTWDFNETRKLAVNTLPNRGTKDLEDRGWGWRCDCGRGHVEDDVQIDGILECEACKKQYVNNEFHSYQ
ncbi:MAG TPA: hypothetical protein ENH49_03660 [Candidatus Marinimicrobia bacterium]|nr:hypothetical protein [Candidatus Neomarinimicrobiota bacterium]